MGDNWFVLFFSLVEDILSIEVAIKIFESKWLAIQPLQDFFISHTRSKGHEQVVIFITILKVQIRVETNTESQMSKYRQYSMSVYVPTYVHLLNCKVSIRLSLFPCPILHSTYITCTTRLRIRTHSCSIVLYSFYTLREEILFI